MPPRRKILTQAAGIAMLATMPWAAQGQASGQGSVQLPAPKSLPDSLKAALQKRQPLVLMVSLDGCPFCKIVREHYLVHMARDDGLPVVQIDMQSKAVLADWAGQSTTHAALIEKLAINVAPTLVFYGQGGKEVAERLVGLSSVDFYSAYLDARIATARSAVGR